MPASAWWPLGGYFLSEAYGAKRRERPDNIEGVIMTTDQYHEPPQELSAEVRTFARMCASLSEEAEAIGWYEQRIAVEQDPAARAIMTDSLGEEYKHFSMEL
jgi:hypothetical protein